MQHPGAQPVPDRDGPPPTHVFVLGTGRCGTKTLARMLTQIEGCRVDHERPPPLLSEVTDFVRERTTENQLIEVLHGTRSTDAIGGARVSGESNQRLSFILPTLHKAFPNARYLWMVRDGRDNVASIHHRRWYDPNEARVREPYHRPSAENRIAGPDMHDMTPDEWARLDAFGRCCWYWAYTNREIARQTASLALPVLRVRLEDLGDRVEDLLTFLALPADTPTDLRTWNAARHGSPLPPPAWSPAERRSFETICGATMDEIYPAWRDRDWEPAPRLSRWRTRAVYAARRKHTEIRIRMHYARRQPRA